MCDCYLNTQILIKPMSCKGLFIFSPDIFTVPKGELCYLGPNNSICSLNINIVINCSDDYKFSLLDKDGNVLNYLIVQCGEYEIVDIENAIQDASSSLLPLYGGTLTNLNYLSEYTQILRINSLNWKLMSKYTNFEESAYFYNKVSQTYLNLWNQAEETNFLCDILKISKNAEMILSRPIEDTNNTVIPIPDNYIISAFSPITLPSGFGNINKIIVKINIQHTFDADLEISLVAPNSSEIVLCQNVGMDSDNFTDTVFDDSATRDIQNAQPSDAPFTGAWRPYQPLSTFNGLPIEGTWQLKVNDQASFNNGKILNWTIAIYSTEGIHLANHLYSLTNNIIKSRALAIQKICECNYFINDKLFLTTPTCAQLNHC